jgi:hypothetical protein
MFHHSAGGRNRQCSGLSYPAKAGMTIEGEDDPTASFNHRHMPRHIARRGAVESRILSHLDLPPAGSKA